MAHAGGAPTGGIALTGFGAFPGVPDNPSARLLEAMRTADLLPSGTRFRLIEVAYAAVPPAIEEILADPSAALVLTGYSACATGLRLETRAHDHCSADHADAFGFVPRTGSEIRHYRDQLRADLPGIAARVAQAGIDCTLSDDCGAYLCNYSYHLALGRIAALGLNTRAVFIHIPAIAGTPLAQTSAGAMPRETMARGVAMVAHALAAATPKA